MINDFGFKFGDYENIRPLGSGGYADVYLVKHIYVGSFAAIKVLRDQVSEESKKEFLEEARTMVKFNHPNIVRLIGFSIQNAVSYLIMDYAPNGSLYERIPLGTQLPLPVVLAYAKAVAAALQYAHNLNVIHCDVKPANILLGPNNEVLLSDFGIATIAHNSRSLKTGNPIGSIEYMSPEQQQGRPLIASDQYALAGAVYLWITGTLPFTGSYREISRKRLSQFPPPLRNKVPGLPVAVQNAVLKALSKESNDRFARVEDFARALEEAIKPNLPIRSSAPNTPVPVNRVPPPPVPVNRIPPPPVPVNRVPPPPVPVNRVPPPPVNRVPASREALSPRDRREIQSFIDQADRYYLDQNYEDAIDEYSKVIAKDSGSAVAYNGCGKSYNGLLNFTRAIQELNQAIALAPNFDWAYSNRGFAYLGLKKYDLAIKDFDKAIKLKLRDAKTYHNRGYAHQKCGEDASCPAQKKSEHYKLAIADYNLALIMSPRYMQAARNREKVFRLLNGI